MSDDQRRSCAPVRGSRLRVLGCFELTTPDGADITPTDLDGRRLLAALALAGGPKSLVELAATLWPELSRVSAMTALSASVAGVAELVDDAGALLTLSPEVSVDLAGTLARLHSWEDDPGTALSVTAEQVGVLAHDLLPGWTDNWVDHERDRYHRLRMHALESLCQLLTRAGRHEPAIGAGQLMVDAEPLREAARRALIEAHVAAGNVSEAVHQYDTFVELCASFGFAPDAELRSFFPPSPAWPVLHVRRPINPGRAVNAREMR
ncbi:MAG: bacterial transcriptional activator domain-containing protein [Actinomycetota bacterium]|nr:bacterial transcriptional activator domain-containing protein [Actinomycetota bacterium]